NDTLLKGTNLAGILVDANNVMAKICKAGSGYETDVSGSDHRNAHATTPPRAARGASNQHDRAIFSSKKYPATPAHNRACPTRVLQNFPPDRLRYRRLSSKRARHPTSSQPFLCLECSAWNPVSK